MLKQQITAYCNANYPQGTLRFLKDKMFIKIFGKQSHDVIQSHNTFLTDSYPLPVLVYNYLHDVVTQPTCKQCHNPTKFSPTNKWPTYCSNKCRFADSDTITAKRQQTNLKKYGSTNVLTSEYGAKKAQQTHLQKYGVKHYNMTAEYRERHKSGDIVRTLDTDQQRRTFRTTFFNKLPQIVPTLTPLFDLEYFIEHGAGSYHNYSWSCNVCSHKFERWLNLGMRPICPQCAPTGTQHEIELKNFLHKHGVEFKYRSRKLLGNGTEIDLFIPSKNIGIEIDGLYWHHELKVGKSYHLDKTNAAEKQGIRLIHIFGDEFYRKEKIVYSRLKHILGIVHRRIYARKCVVRKISNSVKSKFLNKYHIQGDGKGCVHLGLFYRDRLVAVMDIGKQRPGIGKTSEENVMELIRFATVSNFTIVGGASKMLKHFQRMNVTNKLISYADRRWSNGDVYKKIGFKLVSTSSPNYWYTKNFTERLHRIGFQRSQLAVKLQNYDPTLSERDNMLNNKFLRVWDCGTLRYELTW